MKTSLHFLPIALFALSAAYAAPGYADAPVPDAAGPSAAAVAGSAGSLTSDGTNANAAVPAGPRNAGEHAFQPAGQPLPGGGPTSPFDVGA